MNDEEFHLNAAGVSERLCQRRTRAHLLPSAHHPIQGLFHVGHFPQIRIPQALVVGQQRDLRFVIGNVADLRFSLGQLIFELEVAANWCSARDSFQGRPESLRFLDFGQL